MTSLFYHPHLIPLPSRERLGERFFAMLRMTRGEGFRMAPFSLAIASHKVPKQSQTSEKRLVLSIHNDKRAR